VIEDENTITLAVSTERIRLLMAALPLRDHATTEEARAFLALYSTALATKLEDTLKKFVAEKLAL